MSRQEDDESGVAELDAAKMSVTLPIRRSFALLARAYPYVNQTACAASACIEAAI